ncbi:MAG: tRNA 2-thiocytidine biosynthesis TtcA family protein [Gammaproteobacteria bacterium]
MRHPPDSLPRPPKALLRPVGRAIADYAMIRAGDRLLLGLSGGKDSLSLLHILRHLQGHAPIPFELAAVTVDPLVDGFDPAPLQAYLAGLGVPFHYVREPIMARAQTHLGNDSYCSWCARMKRGLMYETARRHGHNVLVLGQHLDDLAESFLMSAFHGGRLQTMKAQYLNDAGDVRVIRPLVYVRERQLRDFSQAAGLPVIRDNCPACFRMPTQRAHMKQLLAEEEIHNKGLFKALLSTLRPLMAEASARDIHRLAEAAHGPHAARG